MSYAIRVGCILKVILPIIELKQGRNPRSRKSKTSAYQHLGDQVIKVEVLKESYGAKAGQHTFTVIVSRRIKKELLTKKEKQARNF